jgi:hypothetical protein
VVSASSSLKIWSWEQLPDVSFNLVFFLEPAHLFLVRGDSAVLELAHFAINSG